MQIASLSPTVKAFSGKVAGSLPFQRLAFPGSDTVHFAAKIQKKGLASDAYYSLRLEDAMYVYDALQQLSRGEHRSLSQLSHKTRLTEKNVKSILNLFQALKLVKLVEGKGQKVDRFYLAQQEANKILKKASQDAALIEHPSAWFVLFAMVFSGLDTETGILATPKSIGNSLSKADIEQALPLLKKNGYLRKQYGVENTYLLDTRCLEKHAPAKQTSLSKEETSKATVPSQVKVPRQEAPDVQVLPETPRKVLVETVALKPAEPTVPEIPQTLAPVPVAESEALPKGENDLRQAMIQAIASRAAAYLKGDQERAFFTKLLEQGLADKDHSGIKIPNNRPIVNSWKKRKILEEVGEGVYKLSSGLWLKIGQVTTPLKTKVVKKQLLAEATAAEPESTAVLKQNIETGDAQVGSTQKSPPLVADESSEGTRPMNPIAAFHALFKETP